MMGWIGIPSGRNNSFESGVTEKGSEDGEKVCRGAARSMRTFNVIRLSPDGRSVVIPRRIESAYPERWQSCREVSTR